ncbi:permease-like cell division protein FtsX [Desulfobacula toluolica]|uniref:Cell division protein FtsX n=1 Tax=Desulfobacula toluolica (strain DSM 7467 / Tol2) TaxID=651182 RepID=K0NQL2_DESTT|nr:permease-like cell division protein FtsX [Desulfobacula toluolica]CCK82443.1 FtsX: cell division protein, predicted permease [Desulfobacula toluolica Tol2]
MTHFLKKAVADIRSNNFLNLITIMTISLSILVVSVFLLFFENIDRVIESWNQGGRAMIYLKKEFRPDMLPELTAKINALGEIDEIVYISKTQALDKLKKEIASKSAFLKTLKNNPLPDALEIRMKPYKRFEKIQTFAQNIKAINIVEDVEYGRNWLGKFLKIFNLFKITGYAMCSLFFLIALFITANTVRLAFYSRKLEIEIMRLVGATETFIKTPFYVESLVQGFLGGIFGLAALLIIYLTASSGIMQSLAAYVYFDIRFLSVKLIILIIAGSTFLGWFGCYLSLKQILK